MTLWAIQIRIPSQWSDNVIPKVQLRIASIFLSNFDHAKWGRWSFYWSKIDHLPHFVAFFLTILPHAKWGRYKSRKMREVLKWIVSVGYRNLGWFHDINFCIQVVQVCIRGSSPSSRLNLLYIPHLAFESKREIIAVIPFYPPSVYQLCRMHGFDRRRSPGWGGWWHTFLVRDIV